MFFLALPLIFAVAVKTSAGDYYSVGVDAFKKGAYDNAASNLEHAIRINPKNVNARYYLAQAYLRQNRICEATSQYDRIILIAPTSDAAILSEKGLSLIQKSYSKGAGIASFDGGAQYKDNYIPYVISDAGSVVKWPSFPLKVYIEPLRQKSIVQKAFAQWQAKSGNLVSFVYVNSPENAQITVNFNNSLGIMSASDEGYTAGLSKPVYEENSIKKSDISILLVEPKTNKAIDDNSILSTTLHEIGHSLGFKGHSPNENDVMFASSETPRLSLSKRDLNTLHLFYTSDSNTLLAKNSAGSGLKLQQAIKYTKDFPNISTGWANLGDIYRSKKMYSNAIENYKKATSIEPDKAVFYSLIGSTYLDMGNRQNALINLKTACDLDKSNLDYLYQFAQLCYTSGQKDTGSSYVKNYVKANPQSISDEKMRALLSLYK